MIPRLDPRSVAAEAARRGLAVTREVVAEKTNPRFASEWEKVTREAPLFDAAA